MKETKNFLDYIPKKNDVLAWSVDENNLVVLEVENKGFFNRMAQKLFKKPPITYVHLDALGSFIWPLIDGTTSLSALAPKVEAEFGEKAQPLYERLAQFFKILESYGFVSLQ